MLSLLLYSLFRRTWCLSIHHAYVKFIWFNFSTHPDYVTFFWYNFKFSILWHARNVLHINNISLTVYDISLYRTNMHSSSGLLVIAIKPRCKILCTVSILRFYVLIKDYKSAYFSRSITLFQIPNLSVDTTLQSHKFATPPFCPYPLWRIQSFELVSSGTTITLNFLKVSQLVKNWKALAHTQTHSLWWFHKPISFPYETKVS
jgi:hypothetical protein